MDRAASRMGGRSRLTAALMWSLLGHAVAIGAFWQTDAWQGIQSSASVATLSPEVHLRTESVPVLPESVPVPPESVHAEPVAVEPAVAALATDQSWVLNDPVSEVDEPISEVEAVSEPEPESMAESALDTVPVIPAEAAPEIAQDAVLDADINSVLDDAMAAYRAELQRALQRLQTYPRRAQRFNLQGVAHVRFHIDANAGITASELVGSSGHAVLDDAARTVVLSLTDLPRFPAELQAQQIDQLSFDVPIEYRLN